jgi:hypothetical protein
MGVARARRADTRAASRAVTTSSDVSTTMLAAPSSMRVAWRIRRCQMRSAVAARPAAARCRVSRSVITGLLWEAGAGAVAPLRQARL